jgi:hypothetical protein
MATICWWEKKGNDVTLLGKNEDGYLTSSDISEQASAAMDMAPEYYGEYSDKNMYDNAPRDVKGPSGCVTG